MKINNTDPRIQLARLERKDSASKPAAEARASDRVSTETKDRLETIAKRSKAAASKDRESRLAELKSQIAKGEFRPDPSKIANEILRDAELEAMLRNMLS